MAFGEQLRRLRGAAGLTQEALARKAGVTVKTVHNLERRAGWGGRSWQTAVKLAEALGVSLDEFRDRPAAAPKRRGQGR
jgi:transcriptional regulator with XRE-family HTH domain